MCRNQWDLITFFQYTSRCCMRSAFVIRQYCKPKYIKIELLTDFLAESFHNINPVGWHVDWLQLHTFVQHVASVYKWLLLKQSIFYTYFLRARYIHAHILQTTIYFKINAYMYANMYTWLLLPIISKSFAQQSEHVLKPIS